MYYVLPDLQDSDRIAGRYFSQFLLLESGKNQRHRDKEDRETKN
jgi:hypothetical protein